MRAFLGRLATALQRVLANTLRWARSIVCCLLASKLWLSLTAVLGVVSLTLAIAWFRMESPGPGPIEVAFGQARMEFDRGTKQDTLDSGVLKVFAPERLPRTIWRLEGSASRLVYNGCAGSSCPTDVSAVSLHAKDPAVPLELANLTWLKQDCEGTALAVQIARDAEKASATISRSGRTACQPKLSLILGGSHVPELSFNPATSELDPPRPGSTIVWRSSEPITLALKAAPGELLSRDAVKRITRITGKLSSPLPRVQGVADRTVCTSAPLDTIEVESDAWEIRQVALNGSLNFEIRSKGVGLLRCEDDATSPDEPSACKRASNACGFDWVEFTSKTADLSPVSVAGLLAALLALGTGQSSIPRRMCAQARRRRRRKG